jgi:hypothetical protein
MVICTEDSVPVEEALVNLLTEAPELVGGAILDGLTSNAEAAAAESAAEQEDRRPEDEPSGSQDGDGRGLMDGLSGLFGRNSEERP